MFYWRQLGKNVECVKMTEPIFLSLTIKIKKGDKLTTFHNFQEALTVNRQVFFIIAPLKNTTLAQGLLATKRSSQVRCMPWWSTEDL